jgi:hypothetical protein
LDAFGWRPIRSRRSSARIFFDVDDEVGVVRIPDQAAHDAVDVERGPSGPGLAHIHHQRKLLAMPRMWTTAGRTASEN